MARHSAYIVTRVASRGRGDAGGVRRFHMGFLVKEVVDINAAPGEGGATALYAVCIQGNCSMAQLLLDARASPNIALKNGETALLAATNTSRLDVARLLLEHSADVNACTAHGKTALMVACHKGDGAMARLHGSMFT
jgi:ankyrin repeat protein